MSSGLACVLSVELCYYEAARLAADGRSMGRACPELGAELLLALRAGVLAVYDGRPLSPPPPVSDPVAVSVELGAELAADLLKLSASLGLAVPDVARALLYATDPAPLPPRPDPYAGAVLTPFWVLEARRRAEVARLS